MLDEDKLFNFISGLQGWAQTELRRQGFRDLPTAMPVADCLVDYKMGGAINTTVTTQIPLGTSLQTNNHLHHESTNKIHK